MPSRQSRSKTFTIQQLRQQIDCLSEFSAAAIVALREVRPEITRVNTAAGHTVFNPAATQLVDDALAQVHAVQS